MQGWNSSRSNLEEDYANLAEGWNDVMEELSAERELTEYLFNESGRFVEVTRSITRECLKLFGKCFEQAEAGERGATCMGRSMEGIDLPLRGKIAAPTDRTPIPIQHTVNSREDQIAVHSKLKAEILERTERSIFARLDEIGLSLGKEEER
jgi:hypothetical protein